MTNAHSIQVELHVPELTPVLEFYLLLGFREVRREERYLVLGKGKTLLHFYLSDPAHSQHHYFKKRVAEGEPLGTGVELIVFVDDLDKAFSQMKANNSVVKELVDRPWGVRDFRVSDPFGYYLRISEPYDTCFDWVRDSTH